MKTNLARWLRYLVIILLGNGLYFALMPYLPRAARHHLLRVDLGTVVDFWFCLIVFGILETAAFLSNRHKNTKR